MALTYPYALSFLGKCLAGPMIPLTLRRFDEMSGSGSGRYWAAEMHKPLWTASYALYAQHAAEAREINAKIWALDGVANPFLWRDPYYRGPASGDAPGTNVTVNSIRADRGAVSLAGLPAGFVLSPGDFVTIVYGGQHYMGSFAEGGTANGPGVIPQVELRPYLPLGVSVGNLVNLINPLFRAVVTDFTPFASTRHSWGDGASITIMQRP